MTENPIFALNARVASLRATGADIVALTAGEPQAPTSSSIIEAAQRAVADPATHHYGPAAGDPVLRRRIQTMLPRSGGEWDIDEVLITAGAKHALYLAVRSLTERGDEVIVVEPGWPGHAHAVRAAGATPVFAAPSHGDRIRVGDLAAVATKRTRAVILASPANPTGAVLGATALYDIAEWAVTADVWVISDDVYAAFDYTGTYTHALDVAPEIRDRTVIVDSVSKEHAMTGWRIGWTAAPIAMIAQAREHLAATVTNIPGAMQRAAIAALADTEGAVAANATYRTRRDRAVAALEALPNVHCPVPDGGMFVFPSVAKLLEERGWHSSSQLVDRLLDAGVAVVPGEAFGAPDRLRLCYAVDDRTLDLALERIATAVRHLQSERAVAS